MLFAELAAVSAAVGATRSRSVKVQALAACLQALAEPAALAAGVCFLARRLRARDPAGGFVMLGKTFKGMTDEVLRWQTERLQALATRREGRVVHVRPELVAEIAFDGIQASRRYPGGMALRFARLRRYRRDKRADQADAIQAVRRLHRRGAAAEPG